MSERQKEILFLSGIFILANAADLLTTMVFKGDIGEINNIADHLFQHHGILAVAAAKAAVTIGGAATFNLVARHPVVESKVASTQKIVTLCVTAMPVVWVLAHAAEVNQKIIINALRMWMR